MLTSSTLQNISHLSQRINKITSTLLSTPAKGYSGNCPFLKGLSTVSESFNFQNSTHQASSSSSCPRESNHSTDSVYGQHHVVQEEEIQQEFNNNSTGTSTQNEPCEREANQISPSDNNAACSNKNNTAKIEEDKKSCCSSSYDYNSKFEELIKMKKDDESYRVFRKVERFSSNFPYGSERGRPITVWCSNDYFGMSSHPKVREAIVRAVHVYGAGSGGTRNIAGNSPVHEQLEWELADLHEKEAALLFSSCYVANDSTLFTLLKLIPNCHIFSDAGNHASMIQGIRNSGAVKHIFKTFDPVDLEEKLKQLPLDVPKIVAFETVHSMSGDISDVEKMCDISHKYGALTFVDEVHAVGLYGDRGAGIAQRDNCMDKIDIVSGTLGKAFGNCGGYVAGNKDLIDVIRSYASGFIFTTSLPPTVACGATESVRILKGDEGRYLRQLQQNNVFHMKRALTAAGLPHIHSKSHIIPIPIGDSGKCAQVSNHLLDVGHYIQSINYPTVPRGTERLRVSVSPFHSETMIDSLIEVIVSIWHRNGLDFLPPVDIINGQCRRHQMLRGQGGETIAISLWCQLCHKEMNLCSRVSGML